MMTQDERMRRAAILCVHFSRNLAYYRAGYKAFPQLREKKSCTIKENDFWITIINNSLDICVLEWCKLFGNNNSNKCHWKNVAIECSKFSKEAMGACKIDEKKWEQVQEEIITYRNKFVAHLDNRNIMYISKMDIPLKLIQFYYSQLCLWISNKDFLCNLPSDISAYYQNCYDVAALVFDESVTRNSSQS